MPTPPVCLLPLTNETALVEVSASIRAYAALCFNPAISRWSCWLGEFRIHAIPGWQSDYSIA